MKKQNKSKKKGNSGLQIKEEDKSSDSVNSSSSEKSDDIKEVEKKNPYIRKSKAKQIKKKKKGKEKVPSYKISKISDLGFKDEELIKRRFSYEDYKKVYRIVYFQSTKEILIVIEDYAYIFSAKPPFSRRCKIKVNVPEHFEDYIIYDDPFGKVWFGYINKIDIYNIYTTEKETTMEFEKKFFGLLYMRQISPLSNGKTIINYGDRLKILDEDYQQLEEITNLRQSIYNMLVLNENSLVITYGYYLRAMLKYDLREKKWERAKEIGREIDTDHDHEELFKINELLYWIYNDENKSLIYFRIIRIEDFEPISHLKIDLSFNTWFKYSFPITLKKNFCFIFKRGSKLFTFSESLKYYSEENTPFKDINKMVVMEEGLSVVMDYRNNIQIFKVEEENEGEDKDK